MRKAESDGSRRRPASRLLSPCSLLGALGAPLFFSSRPPAERVRLVGPSLRFAASFLLVPVCPRAAAAAAVGLPLERTATSDDVARTAGPLTRCGATGCFGCGAALPLPFCGTGRPLVSLASCCRPWPSLGPARAPALLPRTCLVAALLSATVLVPPPLAAAPLAVVSFATALSLPSLYNVGAAAGATGGALGGRFTGTKAGVLLLPPALPEPLPGAPPPNMPPPPPRSPSPL
mmetsp:Transcript_7246/g.23191  ORF Transcript_7246/g.23191 Transcript_7246/m.23191 type:complete len:233 (-) Transcript_7246:811-1509(-)